MSPHDLAESRVEMAGEYSYLSERLSNILTEKPGLWNVLRENVKSDKAADRMWESSAGGIEEMKLRLKMKALEKKMSAAKTMLEVLEGEARNQY